jgi:hypothetical protein
MNFVRAFTVVGVLAATPAWAVYAPLPDQTLNKNWTVAVRGGVSHDSNIFGAQSNEVASAVYSVSPSIDYSGSLDDQTFAAFNYTLTIDHFDNRPGEKTLDSHSLLARIAHAFGPSVNVDVSDQYQIAKNPESLLAGLPLNTNQSFKRNEADARVVSTLAPKIGATFKFRSINYAYDNPTLAANIDRTENLFGVAGSYDVLPELKAVAEYRHEDVDYRTGGATKDKKSDFLMGGLDYAVARKVSFSGRLGGEWRDRASERSTSSPYAELSAKYDYAERSFLAAGYVYTLEETSNVALYTDTQVNRMFVNVQQALSALVVASASFTYEPSQLQGRRGIHTSVDETTTRFGAALTWLPTPHWSMSATYDHDDVDSEDPSRGQKRDRYGVNAGYSF